APASSRRRSTEPAKVRLPAANGVVASARNDTSGRTSKGDDESWSRQPSTSRIFGASAHAWRLSPWPVSERQVWLASSYDEASTAARGGGAETRGAAFAGEARGLDARTRQ